MERLIAWYRVGSSYGALVALVVANLIPLAGVLFLGWSVWQILIIYWLENGIVGFYNVLKMLKAEGTGFASMASYRINGRSPVGMAKAALVPFFCLHYGIFWAVHGLFVLMLPLFGATMTGGESSFGTTPDPPCSSSPSSPSSSATACRTCSTSSAAASTSASRRAVQMGKPYGRLVVLHVTIIIGAMAISITGAAIAALAVLVLLKIGLDVGLHLAEHRGLYAAPTAESARVALRRSARRWPGRRGRPGSGPRATPSAARTAPGPRSPGWPPPGARRSWRCRSRPWRPARRAASGRSTASESRPPRCFVVIGTPMTGRLVFAASMPGRWAAPPAPAMMTRSPRPGASSA